MIGELGDRRSRQSGLRVMPVVMHRILLSRRLWRGQIQHKTEHDRVRLVTKLKVPRT
jgi:hypothetical protein